VRSLAIAIQFLTRIPIRIHGIPTAQEIGASLNYYPVVGLLLGVILSASAWMLQNAPAMLVAALVTVMWIVLTGALHLDGLADSADAWIGGLGDKEKTLRIMKDVACGPAGVVAIVTVVLLKFAAVYSLLQLQKSQLIFLAPLLSRSVVMLLISCTPYVRENGLGASLKQQARPFLQFTIGGIIVTVLLLILGIKFLSLFLTLFAVVIFIRHAVMKRLSGLTGDLIGAVLEISEVTVLLCLTLYF